MGLKEETHDGIEIELGWLYKSEECGRNRNYRRNVNSYITRRITKKKK